MRPSASRLLLLTAFAVGAVACPSVDETDSETDIAVLDGILDGDPGDPALAALTDLDIPEPDNVVELDALRLVPDRVIVVLSDEATIGGVNAYAAAIDADLIGVIADVGLLVLSNPDRGEGWLTQALDEADSSPDVEAAAPSTMLEANVLAPDHRVTAGGGPDPVEVTDWKTEAGGEWGLAFVGAPTAWNLHAAVEAADAEPPHVLIMDGGFEVGHADVVFADGTADNAAANNHHGTSVASAIASGWDGTGIESVFPASTTYGDANYLPIAGRPASSTGVHLQHLRQALTEAQGADRPLVANLSFGTTWWDFNADGSVRYQISPSAEITYDGDLLAIDKVRPREAALIDAFTRRVGYDRWLFTQSAGNTNAPSGFAERVGLEAREIDAKFCSGFAYASLVTGNDHILTVEALNDTGKRHEWSNQSATIAAPGIQIALARDGDGYRLNSGTSFSSPMVASAAVYLWTLFPDATHAQIREALISGAKTGFSDPLTARRLDVPGAIQHLRAELDDDLDLYLADVDDRTRDGSSRGYPLGVDPGGFAVQARGNGCVDMADFRAFRDALYDASTADLGGYEPFWLESQSRRDQNGDGLVRYIEHSHEGQFSRFDLDLDGAVTTDDLAVMQRAWGQCVDDAVEEAITEGLAADALPGLIDSVDVWVKLDGDLDGDATLSLPGRLQLPLDADDIVNRTVDGHVLATIPTSACDGGLNLILDRGDEQRRYRTPDGATVARSLDYVVDERTFEALDGSTARAPALYRTGGGGTSFVRAIYKGSVAWEFEDFKVPYHAGPIGLGDTVQMSMYNSGRGRVDVVIDGVKHTLRAPDEEAILAPFHWAADGSGFLATSYFGGPALYWADMATLSLVEVAPSVPKRFGSWPSVHRGFIYFVGNDDALYRVGTRPVTPPDASFNWAEELREGPVCGEQAELGEVHKLADLSTLPGATLAHALPSAVSSWGSALLRVRDGDAWDLWVYHPHHDDLIQVLDDVDLMTRESEYAPTDGTSWSWDAARIAYVDDGAVGLVDLLDGSIYDPSRISTSELHDAPGFAVFNPYASNTVAIQEITGHWANPLSEVHLYDAGSGSLTATLEVEPKCGTPAWSADGRQLALGQKPAAGLDWISRRPSWTSGADKTVRHNDCDIVWVKADTGEIVEDTAYELYTTSSGGEAFTDDAYVSWGVDFGY